MKKLVIFGVGLIGGSTALALKEARAVQHIVGVGRHSDNLQRARELGVIDAIETNVAAAMQDADVVLIATPVAQTPIILEQLRPHLAPTTLITDAGSTKSDVAQYAVDALGDMAKQFIPGHPIAGAEKSGVTAAKADLFQSKNVVLTPFQETSKDSVTRICQFWQLCGANVMTMSPYEHDRIFAAVSHLPHLLAFALVDELSQRKNAPTLFNFAASGFRDFTRIAGSHPEMWRDIAMANRDALLQELKAYHQKTESLISILEDKDANALFDMFERASQARNAWGQRH